MEKLNDIGLRKGTDKASDIHDYLRKYEKYFPFKRDDKLKILEIGVLDGCSLATWKEYYHNSKIAGIDINPDCKKYEDGVATIEIGSQYDENFLKEVAEKHGPFDFILDDGSHINKHVIFSFQHLFKHLKSQGLYIVEDVCTSYWKEWGGEYKSDDSSIEYFKNLIDEVNFYGHILYDKPNVHARRDDYLFDAYKSSGIENFGMHIESINFINGIIIITKK